MVRGRFPSAALATEPIINTAIATNALILFIGFSFGFMTASFEASGCAEFPSLVFVTRLLHRVAPVADQ
jgi:hypothetical protein